jgi:hypothetical protein
MSTIDFAGDFSPYRLACWFKLFGGLTAQKWAAEAVCYQIPAVAAAMDRINDTYGEFVLTPALMMGMDDTIIDRIAFGGVKELEELYQS